jgi:outer membrane protein with beta-barrel domain
MAMSTRRVLQTAALAAACVVLPATRANAQLTLGVGGGASFPVGSLHDQFVTGYNVLAQLGIGLPSWPVGLRVDGMFNQMNHRATVASGNLQLWTANANVVWNIVPISTAGAGVTPYLIGGLGYYNSSFHVSASGSSFGGGGNTHANNFGLNGGAGIKAGVATLSVFVEARYHYVFVSGGHIQFIPITAGIIF